MYEGSCERLPDESDEAYLTRCGNDMFNQQFGISQLSNIPNVMKQKIVVPNKIEERLNNIAWDRMQDDIKDMQKQCKAMAQVIIKNLDHLKSDIYDKARNIPPDIK